MFLFRPVPFVQKIRVYGAVDFCEQKPLVSPMETKPTPVLITFNLDEG